MFKALRDALFANLAGRPSADTAPAPPPPPPPASVTVEGQQFDVAGQLHWHEGLPHLDWSAVHEWIASLPDAELAGQAWSACEAAWLEHLAASAGLHVYTGPQTHVITSLDVAGASNALRIAEHTRADVLQVLSDLARDEGWGRHIVVLFNDEDSYYRYVSNFYPDSGEFAITGGMFINAGCAHFVAVLSQLHQLQPTIAHETTHALLSHLPIPAWLNEGLAVNTERRLFPPARNPGGSHATPQQMHRRHCHFWNPELAQAFWSGDSFLRADEGNELSYDLARILVEIFSKDWSSFSAFANAAQMNDAGAAAAREHLGVDLGPTLAALLDQDNPQGYAPDPARWANTPQRGGF